MYAASGVGALRWKHEAVLEAMQARLERMPEAPRIRRQTAEHVFGTLKLDGRHALPDEEITERENGDESARAGLQPQTRRADPRSRTSDERHVGMKCLSFFVRIESATKLHAQPRSTTPTASETSRFSHSLDHLPEFANGCFDADQPRQEASQRYYSGRFIFCRNAL
jgi:hypothetical protein